MNPALRHHLSSLALAVAGAALVAAANYLQANPIPNLDPVWGSFAVMALRALAAWVSQQQPADRQPSAPPDPNARP